MEDIKMTEQEKMEELVDVLDERGMYTGKQKQE